MDNYLNCSKCGISTPVNEGTISVICNRCTTRAISTEEPLEKQETEKPKRKKKSKKGVKCIKFNKIVKRVSKACDNCEYMEGCELHANRRVK